jgi:hypothetical protein
MFRRISSGPVCFVEYPAGQYVSSNIQQASMQSVNQQMSVKSVTESMRQNVQASSQTSPNVNQALCLGLSVYLWLYSPFLDLGRFFNFLILYTVGRTLWTGDQTCARPLPAHRTAQT